MLRLGCRMPRSIPRDDEFQVGASVDQVPQESEENIGVDRALVGFVEYDARVLLEVGVAQELAKHDSVGHVADHGRFAKQVHSARKEH